MVVPVELVETARRLGAKTDVADLADLSIKDAGTLRVKRVGATLAGLCVDDFVELDRARLDAILETGFPREEEARARAFEVALLGARLPGNAEHPVVDALIHHMLPGRVVAYLHPEALCAITCCGSGQYLAKAWFREHAVPVVWLERVEEGVLLAKALGRTLAKAHKPAIDAAVLVSNGGVYLQGEEPADIDAALEALLATLAERVVEQEVTAPEAIGSAQPSRLAAFAEAFGVATASQATAASAADAVLELLARPAVRDASLRGPIGPDQVVHCGSYPAYADDVGGKPGAIVAAALAEHREANQEAPRVLLVCPHGLVAAGPSPGAAAAAAQVFASAAAVYVRSERMGVTRILPAKERRALEPSSWTRLRRSLAAG